MWATGEPEDEAIDPYALPCGPQRGNEVQPQAAQESPRTRAAADLVHAELKLLEVFAALIKVVS